MNEKTKILKEKMVAHFGGITGLARALKINRCAIYQWDSIPVGRSYQIEVLSAGKFMAEKIQCISFRKKDR